MAGSNNENDINKITNFNESAVTSGLETYLTPNMGQDNKINELNVTNEVNITNDSGRETTPSPVSYTHLDVYKRQSMKRVYR